MSLELIKVQKYVEANISHFHSKRLESLDKLDIGKIIVRKNPYLFRAKNLGPAELVKSLADAIISSNEETVFGDWLEGLAIFVNSQVFGGRKSGIQGIDLEFEEGEIKYIVSIKSGPNWGNSSQMKKMVQDFKSAKKVLRTSNSNLNVVAVNGCCYGRDNRPDKGDYFKYCGEMFWHFISGDPSLYKDLIKPLGHNAKLRNDEFLNSYNKKISVLQRDFLLKFCTADGAIDWGKIVELNSGKIK
ncbi:MAG: hypothetical protein HBSAPP04_09830 [Ignavibacteriaceae bacterium]|nr:MAG: hypothetical protein HBSAPP04_09830 [Ignavibacteriaceae bacterium]